MNAYYITLIIININELANQFLWKILGRVVLSGKPIYSEICMFNVVHVSSGQMEICYSYTVRIEYQGGIVLS